MKFICAKSDKNKTQRELQKGLFIKRAAKI